MERKRDDMDLLNKQLVKCPLNFSNASYLSEATLKHEVLVDDNFNWLIEMLLKMKSYLLCF